MQPMDLLKLLMFLFLPKCLYLRIHRLIQEPEEHHQHDFARRLRDPLRTAALRLPP